MKNVEELLQDKGHEVWSVSPEASVYEAIEMMATKHIGVVLVMEGKNLRGILSERDYARSVILKGKRSKETKVREIMTTKVAWVPPSRSVDECMALMTDKRIRHLPVVVNDEVKGIISIGDVVRSVIKEKQFMIEQLENYIRGG